MYTTTICTLAPPPAPPEGHSSLVKRISRAIPARRPYITAPVLAWAAVILACGNGGPGLPETPEATTPASRPPTACDIDLATDTPDAVIFGAEAGDFLADRFSLTSGDFNGDGRDDVLIGAPLADGPGNTLTNAGEAYVIFGGGSLRGSIDLAAAGAGLAVLGDTLGGNLGFTVASGDVNGDRIDDVLVGARFAGPGAQAQSGEGEAYVIYGRSDLGGTVDIALGNQDVTVTGAGRGDYLSIALASSDVDGDGVSDLLLGASGVDGPTINRGEAGAVYVVLGSKDLPALIELGKRQPYLTIWGAQPADLLPNYLAAGDVDGDGKAELIAGAPSAGRPTAGGLPSGEVYIIDVPDAPGSEIDLASDQGFTRLRGAAALDGFGFFVAAADVDDDGREDVIIGARDADGPNDSRNNAGEVHLLLGQEHFPSFIDLAQTALDVTISGPQTAGSLGFTVASGDVNGDGMPDLLAGAPIGDGCGLGAEDAGEAYVIFGRSSWPRTLDLAEGEYDLSLFGSEAGDELGFSLAAGDVDGDGRDDILAGALQADGPDNARPDSGEAYLILSR